MLISGQFETNLIFGTPPSPYCLTETKYEHFLLRTDPLLSYVSLRQGGGV